jgi:hypothetical protein
MSYGQRVRMGGVLFSMDMDGLRPTVRQRLSVPLCGSLCTLCTFFLAQRTRRYTEGHRGMDVAGRISRQGIHVLRTTVEDGGVFYCYGWPTANGSLTALCVPLWFSVHSVYLFSCTEDTEVAQRDTEEWPRRSAFPVRGFMSYGQREGMGGVLFSMAMDGLRPTFNPSPVG